MHWHDNNNNISTLILHMIILIMIMNLLILLLLLLLLLLLMIVLIIVTTPIPGQGRLPPASERGGSPAVYLSNRRLCCVYVEVLAISCVFMSYVVCVLGVRAMTTFNSRTVLLWTVVEVRAPQRRDTTRPRSAFLGRSLRNGWTPGQ